MGRANVYLPDDLERRVRAARVPISEVCQRALLAAVEAAEAAPHPFGEVVGEQFRQGWQAGVDWTASANQLQLLGLLREQRLAEIPAEALPHDLYALTQEQSLGWEAGFLEGARSALRDLVASLPAATPSASERTDGPADGATDGTGGATSVADQPPATEPDPAGTNPGGTNPGGPDPGGPATGDGLGDDSGCHIGHTIDGEPVSVDPHAAVRAGRSPLFAILGEADQRAALSLSVAQDAAARGTAVLLVDLSGQLTAHATGLGKNVRIVRNQLALPPLDELAGGAVGLGGLWQTLSQLSGGAGLSQLLNKRPGANLIEPGYLTVLDLSGDGALGTAISAAQGLAGLLGPADFPRLLQVDLPSTVTIPAGLSARLGRIIRTAREQNAAVGLSAESAGTVSQLAGSGALLSTVFAFATSSPAEADRLRDLLGAGAPVLLNAPGASHQPGDESWAVLRDLSGRLGQVRIGAA
ncbi:MAG: hypothetical protein ACR2N4_18030 [Jatrophihabitans sp.]